jgi:hypothetical protein
LSEILFHQKKKHIQFLEEKKEHTKKKNTRSRKKNTKSTKKHPRTKKKHKEGKKEKKSTLKRKLTYVNVVGVEVNSCSTFDTPHLHKARNRGKYLASTKKSNSNEGDHDHETNDNNGENTLKTTMMMTTTMK